MTKMTSGMLFLLVNIAALMGESENEEVAIDRVLFSFPSKVHIDTSSAEDKGGAASIPNVNVGTDLSLSALRAIYHVSCQVGIATGFSVLASNIDAIVAC